MWEQARRYVALSYLNLSEAVLRTVGRRPSYGVLEIEMSGDLGEEPGVYRLLRMSQRQRLDHFNLIALLRWARSDPDLRGVFIRCSDLRVGWAKAQEVSRSIRALRSAGKRVWVYLTHAGIREYVIASAADRVVLTPVGTLDVTGVSTEVTFIAGTLRKLGIEAEVVQMGKYKSAAETFTHTQMSEAHREMMEGLVQDLYDQVVDAIASGRGLDAAGVRERLDCGPFVAREALEARLVDALMYEDEAAEKLRELCGGAAAIEALDYLQRRGRWVRRQVLRRCSPTIAVLHVAGTLKMGDSVPGPDVASACGAGSVARDLKQLRERSDVRGVVLRISSPGGSGLASDLIWHEVVRTRRCKPVVVSFGDVAASGGYYVAVAARPVVAEAGTLTGSIGVIAGKAVLRGLYEQLGVTKQVITRGRHAALYSDYIPLGAEERQRLQTEAERFYADFLDRVSSGREMSTETVSSVAQGRVWTGRQAQSIGLVDQLGGVEQATEQLKKLCGLSPDELVAVERYPKPKRLWRLSFNLSPIQSHSATPLSWIRFFSGERVWALLPFDFRFF